MQRIDRTRSTRKPVARILFGWMAAIAALLLAMLPRINGADAAEKTIRLGVPPHGWPPYIIVHQDRISGIAVDIVRDIGTRRGFVINIHHYPEKRAHKMVEQGKIDAWPDAKEWSATPERFLWTDPIVESEDRLIYRKNTPVVFNRIEDLFGKTIGTHLGYYYPRLERHFENGNIVRADTHGEPAMLKMLFLGRTDAAVINKLVALWVIKSDRQMQGADFTFSEQIVDRAGYRIMFTRRHDWAPFINDFNTDLKAMKQDGRIDQMLSRYRP
ncbi:MAG: transporter substrate-binding domain-containing protein [Deltaproteobacteria bacterium]|nr:transporter substrate-binding domain-containing protein [Deltaproteobacteria bacterium]